MKKMIQAVFVSLLFVTGWANSAEAPYDIEGATTISISDARWLYEQGAVFIDVRDKKGWDSGHVDGAIHLDFEEDFLILYLSDSLDRNTPIVFYSNSSIEHRAALASSFAVNWGYKNVYFLRDGFFGWVAKDHPSAFAEEGAVAKIEVDDQQ